MGVLLQATNQDKVQSVSWVIQNYECAAWVLSFSALLLSALALYGGKGKSSSVAKLPLPVGTMDIITTETGTGCLSLEHNPSC